MRSLYGFNPLVDRPRRSRRRGVVSRRRCSSVAEQADGGELRARTKAGAAAPCWATAKLTWVSLPARPRPRSVLLCVPTPCLSSMAQPDLRLHPVRGRRLSEAAMGGAFDGCRKAAQGSSMGTQGSSRRRPWCHRGVCRWPERALLEVRTAVGRRVWCSARPGRSTQTYYRAEGALEPL